MRRQPDGSGRAPWQGGRSRDGRAVPYGRAVRRGARASRPARANHPARAKSCRDDGLPGAAGLLAGAIGYALAACVQLAPGELALPTPCAEWDLRMLLGHLGESMADLEAGLRGGRLDLHPDPLDSHPLDTLGPSGAVGPLSCGDDPVEALRDCAANLLFACYATHGPDRFVLVGGLPLPAGIVACTGAVEIAVHGWDVCAARGRGGPIPARLATRMLRLCPLLVAGSARACSPNRSRPRPRPARVISWSLTSAASRAARSPAPGVPNNARMTYCCYR